MVKNLSLFLQQSLYPINQTCQPIWQWLWKNIALSWQIHYFICLLSSKYSASPYFNGVGQSSQTSRPHGLPSKVDLVVGTMAGPPIQWWMPLNATWFEIMCALLVRVLLVQVLEIAYCTMLLNLKGGMFAYHEHGVRLCWLSHWLFQLIQGIQSSHRWWKWSKNTCSLILMMYWTSLLNRTISICKCMWILEKCLEFMMLANGAVTKENYLGGWFEMMPKSHHALYLKKF